MADAQRLAVKNLVLHHAVTPLWDDKSKVWLSNWFSSNGFARAYGSNPANWSGLINPYTGQRSYSQAQYAGQRVTSRTPDATAAEKAAGFRLVPLVRDPFGVICWHAGNWTINRGSIGLENLGDYRNYTLRDGDCKVIAAFWRKQDQKMNGDTKVWGHKEVSQTGTECPARIMEQRNKVVQYVNNPPKGDEMASIGIVNVIRRFYLGDQQLSESAKKRYLAMTPEEVKAYVQKSAALQRNIEQAKAGKLDVKSHLPTELRTLYKDPVATEPQFEQVNEQLYRKKT